jgi:hypothetical protein
MTFEEATRMAALAADHAVSVTMNEYRAGHHRQEEAITGVLLGSIRSGLSALNAIVSTTCFLLVLPAWLGQVHP